MGRYLLAHDIGTSGDKASLFSVDGRLIRSTTAGYEVHYGNGGKAEQDPRDWWRAVCASTREITEGIGPEGILAVSFSAQMQCCLVVDREGTPLRPAMIWADQRAEKQAEELRSRIPDEEAYQLLGHRISPAYSLEKLMWVRDEEPEIYEKTYKMLQVKDYIIFRMTGKFVTDHSDASGTNAMDLEGLCWSERMLRAADISMEKLPELHASTDVIGNLLPQAAGELGLSESVQVVCGGGDGPCSALGAGCVRDDEMFLTFGTSAWIGGTTNKKFLDKDKVFFCFAHVIPGKYMPCGTMQSAGSSYSYLRNTFFQDVMERAKEEGRSPWEEMNRMAEAAPAGARGLLFLPYLAGERAPRWNPDASGCFMGIRMYHGREDYVRSVLEGVALNLERILAQYRKYLDVSRMILTGGGAKGNVVAQILADVLEAELVRPDHVEEATSIAAAVIAGVGCGVYQDFQAIHDFLSFPSVTRPRPGSREVYAKAKELFEKLYQALEPLYGEWRELESTKSMEDFLSRPG
ncbi:MAG: FGGY-family carbohydrate kinase [Eubacteriales bacterium]|nr:FGGY-family carbohydrate kinase [Eubacteriales bacterium]